MTKRKMTLLIIAGIIAFCTVLVARSLMTPQAQNEVAVVKTTEIIAAARDLPVGTILKETDLKWIQWTAESDTSQLFVKGKDDMTRATGAILRDGVRTGEPILSSRIVQPRNNGFLAAVLAPGMRAISVTLAPSSEVAGFIFPGDRVDVILTHVFSRKDSDTFNERRVSETVLSDVRVLALDQKSDGMSTDPKIAQLATLEVTPKQAEKLSLAADIAGTPGANARGNITLSLRSLAREEDEALAAMGGTTPTIKDTTTWDSDVSPAYPGVNGDDGLMQRVHIMRGKEAVDTHFERRKPTTAK
ncbi:MAG: Flp pilus assembly protein CpaB [Alphaproteobacteria bacterium]